MTTLDSSNPAKYIRALSALPGVLGLDAVSPATDDILNRMYAASNFEAAYERAMVIFELNKDGRGGFSSKDVWFSGALVALFDSMSQR